MAGGIIVVYHRIAPPGNDPFGLRVAPERFDMQLRLLRELAVVVPLRELVARGGLPDRSIAVTFDDGTPDTVEAALPLLEARGLPATVFVTTSPRCNREYWWEELASLLLRPGRLPQVLELTVGRRVRRWHLGDDAIYDGAAAVRDRDWRAFSGTWPTRRHRLFEEVWEAVRPLAPRARAGVMDRLREWAGARERRRRPRARPLTGAEIRTLASSPFIELGGHTSTHPMLSARPEREQWREILGGRQRLERLAGVQAQAFAYPHGGTDCFTPTTVELVGRAGFRLACTTVADRVGPQTEPRLLPRLCVGDWEEGDFRRWIAGWLG